MKIKLKYPVLNLKQLLKELQEEDKVKYVYLMRTIVFLHKYGFYVMLFNEVMKLGTVNNHNFNPQAFAILFLLVFYNPYKCVEEMLMHLILKTVSNDKIQSLSKRAHENSVELQLKLYSTENYFLSFPTFKKNSKEAIENHRLLEAMEFNHPEQYNKATTELESEIRHRKDLELRERIKTLLKKQQELERE